MLPNDNEAVKTEELELLFNMPMKYTRKQSKTFFVFLDVPLLGVLLDMSSKLFCLLIFATEI